MSAHKKDNKGYYQLYIQGVGIVLRRHKGNFLTKLKRYYKEHEYNCIINKIKG